MKPATKFTYRLITTVSLVTLTGAASLPLVVTPPATVAQAAVKDGSYQTTVQFFKTGTTTASESNQFFDSQATVKVSGGKLQLVLKMKSGANYLKQLEIKDSNDPATIDLGDNNTATVTLDLPDTSGKYTVAMDLQIIPGVTMHETADLQIDLSKLPQASSSSAASAAASSSVTSAASASSTSSSAAAATSSASSSKASSKSQTGTSKASSTSTTSTGTTSTSSTTTGSSSAARVLPLAIRKTAAVSQTSEASAFFAPQVTVTPAGDRVKLAFQLTSGSQYIKQITLNGQSPTTTTSGGTTTYTFTLSKAAYQLGGGQFAFALSIPGGVQMNETAYAIWNSATFSPTKLAAFLASQGTPTTSTTGSSAATSTSSTTSTATTTSAGIDPTKEIQDISYAVYKEDQSGLSDANAYYTHTAHVVKTGTSGYAVTLTVKAPTGVVNFSPLSVAAGPITGQTHQTSGSSEVWTYTFHIDDATALNKPVAGQIAVGVPMLNMSTETYRVWFHFGQSQLGGGPSTTSLASSGDGGLLTSLTGDGTGTAASPSATAATTTSTAANGALPASSSPAATVANFNLKAAQKLLARYKVPSKALHRLQASLIDYPIVQALTAFLAAGLAIIAATLLWQRRLLKQAKGNYHDEIH